MKTSDDADEENKKKKKSRTHDRNQGEIEYFPISKRRKLPQVSNKGRFKSTTGKISTPNPRKSGYTSIRIMGKSYLYHGLVARSFHGPAPTPRHTVDHIDGNPENNEPSNLRWATPQEQRQYSQENNKDRRSNAENRSKPILGRILSETTKGGGGKSSDGQSKEDDGTEAGDDEWVRFDSAPKAAKELGMDKSSIRSCCNGKRTKVKDKDGQWWTFIHDPAATAPLEDEEWRDVVMMQSEDDEIQAL